MKCMQCQEASSAYKCPACRVFKYCSVSCFKLHKDDCQKVKAEKTEDDKLGEVSVLSNSETEVAAVNDWLLSSSQKQKLVEDKKIVSALSSKELQGIIRSINKAQNRGFELQRFISSNEDFAIFINQLLGILRPELGLGQAALSPPPDGLGAVAGADDLEDALDAADPSIVALRTLLLHQA
eukprot:gb/GEZN01015734.1/.p1 GENE.gb/GEZN01015734.1/~~gb/GEZN01015734.1/.p1  ORF type:complete len:181 (-),score=35.98 gb/GEZN01015734.1/:83-625(-)